MFSVTEQDLQETHEDFSCYCFICSTPEQGLFSFSFQHIPPWCHHGKAEGSGDDRTTGLLKSEDLSADVRHKDPIGSPCPFIHLPFTALPEDRVFPVTFIHPKAYRKLWDCIEATPPDLCTCATSYALRWLAEGMLFSAHTFSFFSH